MFRRLDRARLERRAVAHVMQAWGNSLDQLRQDHAAFRKCGDPVELHRSSEAILESLNQAFYVGSRPLELCDQPRPHRRNRQGKVVEELHGDCTYGGSIRVFLRTAVREQPIALLTFLQTLLHEWVHHYDYQAFGDSVHCGGFYRRLAQLYGPARDTLAHLAESSVEKARS